MIFYSTYNILDEVLYKKLMSGTIIDVQFSLNEEMGVLEESYGVKFDDGSYEMFINAEDLTYRAPIPRPDLS